MVKTSAWAAVIWDWGIHFHACWWGCQLASVLGWLWVGGFSSCSSEALQRLCESPHDTAVGFHQSKCERKNNIFCNLISEMTHSRFRYILFFRTQSLSPAYTLGGELSSTSRRQGNERICRPIFKTLNSFKNYKNEATIGPCNLTPEHVFPEKNMVQKDTHTPIFINY